MTENKDTTSQKVSGFLERNIKNVVIVCAVLICGIAAFAVYDSVSKKQNEKVLALVDEISFALTDGSVELSAEDLFSRRAVAKNNLEPLLSRNGIGGVRANMLAAEIAYQEKDFDAAMNYWAAVAKKSGKSYTAPLANYNAGVNAEMAGKVSDAADFYKAASENADFLMKTHAAFSYGRVLESLGKSTDAIEVYEKLVADNPDDSWANLAKTRLIALNLNK